MTERRTANRMDIEISTRAELVEGDKASDDIRWFITRDVSATGAFLVSDAPYPLAATLRLIMDLGRHWVEVVGNVVRVDSQGMGVQFATVQVNSAR